MSKRDAALAWAARGFPVFPLEPNGKLPEWDDSWYNYASTDPETVRSMWTDPVLGTAREYNIGVNCTGMVVIDIDVKDTYNAKTGEFGKKDGYNQYIGLGGTFETLVVRTPTGGYHCYFQGPDSANVNIAEDIEIRSHHGYVVAPGSTIDGVPYAVVADRTPEYIPQNLVRLLQAPHVRKELQGDIELDTAANIQAAINYLETTPPAIEGQRGDETTFIVAARLVRELGLSEFTAFELMRDYYNPRCEPPWQLDELQKKVENASSYGTADLGRLDPTIAFAAVAGLDLQAPPLPLSEHVDMWGNSASPEAITPRPWLVYRLLMTGKITAIAGAGAGGKSSIALALAAHIVLGLDFAGHTLHKRGKVVMYNGEDDKEEQSRRLLAVCMTYGFDYNIVRKGILLLSYEDVDLKFVRKVGHNLIVNEPIVEGFCELLNELDVVAFIVDPLVDIHEGNELDATDMNLVLRTLQNIATRTYTAGLVLHHSTKSGGDRQENRVGNADIFRGTSAIINKVRIGLTVMDASQEDAELYGMQDHERHEWARLDDAKANLSSKRTDPVWLRKVGQKIPSGDVVGVLHVQSLSRSLNPLRIRIGELLINTMRTTNAGSMTITQAVQNVRINEPLWANKKDADIKTQLEHMFAASVDIRGTHLQILREAQEGKPDRVTVVIR